MQLTPHFSLAEMTRSETAARRGISNRPSPVHLENLRRTAAQMETIRLYLGRPISINSCYRAPAVNKAVGGSATSSHCEAEAVDFEVAGMTISQVVAKLRQMPGLRFDQLIDEFGAWVHIGFGPRMRGQVIKARKSGGRTVYSPM